MAANHSNMMARLGGSALSLLRVSVNLNSISLLGMPELSGLDCAWVSGAVLLFCCLF